MTADEADEFNAFSDRITAMAVAARRLMQRKAIAWDWAERNGFPDEQSPGMWLYCNGCKASGCTALEAVEAAISKQKAGE